ncbi:MAG: penicillin-binding protein 2 [Planctomycetes bacterium]|nr:penicillin-binding protein 2 [Planctomycetota bacterium]
MPEARSQYPPVSPTMRIRSTVAVGTVSLALVLLVGRAFYIQVLKGDEYTRMAREQSLRAEQVPGTRGTIFDATGVVLAKDVPAYSVWIYVPEVQGVDSVLAELARCVDFDAARVRARISAGGLFVPVARKIPVEIGHSLQDARMPGVSLLPDTRRVYPLGEAAAPIIGAVGFEGQGLTGVEAEYDSVLAGRPGSIVITRDGAGRVRGFEADPDRRSMPGKDLCLTLRSRVQESAHRAVSEAVLQFEAVSASAVVVDARTGDVLALVCVPSFEPAEPGKAEIDSMRIRPVTDAFEPGSSFKPFIMAGAVELGLVDLDEEWHCGNGAWRHGGRLLHDAHPYGFLNTRMVLIKSSNIGMAKIGLRIHEKIGYEGMHQMVSAFGFGRPAGIGLPGETPGLLLPHTRWTSYSVTSIPMGQEIAVSPLQLSLGYAAIVNGGWLNSPRLVDRWVSGTYEEKLEGPPPAHRVISASTSAVMRSMMERVVLEGTGKRAALKDYRVGGKTGTAQKARDGVYVDGLFTGVFVGFAPADNPKVVCAVLVDEPGKSHYGGTVAAPACRNIIESAMLDLGVLPSAPPVVASHP